MLRRTVLLSLFTLFLFSCEDDEPKATTTSLQIKAETTNRSLTIEDSKGTSFNITELRIGVGHVEFETEQDSSHKIEGPFIIDLINGSATPSLTTTTIPAGAYTRVDVKIDDTDDDFPGITQSDPLFAYSLYGKGTYGTKPFLIKLKFNEDVRFDFQDALQVTAENANSFKLTLKASEWFALVDLSDCIDEISANDTLLISDSGNCSEIEGPLKSAIKTMYDFDKQ